jgi:hypothetical protein
MIEWFTSLLPLRQVMFVENKVTSCKASNLKIVTWQPVDEAPVAKIQVTVMLPFSSTTAMEDWRPVVSIQWIFKIMEILSDYAYKLG